MELSHPKAENEASYFLVKLWQDGITEYRRVAQPNMSEEPFLRDLLPVDALYHAAISEWNAFRSQSLASKHKNLNRVKNTLHNVLRSLHENISTLDALIAFPTQALNSHLLALLTGNIGIST